MLGRRIGHTSFGTVALYNRHPEKNIGLRGKRWRIRIKTDEKTEFLEQSSRISTIKPSIIKGKVCQTRKRKSGNYFRGARRSHSSRPPGFNEIKL